MREPFSFNSFYLLVLRKITNSVTKTTTFPHGGKSEIFFLPYVLDLIKLLRAKILPIFQFEGKTDVWISQVRRVKGITVTSSMIGEEVLSPSPLSSPSLDGVSTANKWQLFSAGFIRCKLVRFSRLLAIMEVAIHPLNNPRKLEKHYSTFRNDEFSAARGEFVGLRIFISFI